MNDFQRANELVTKILYFREMIDVIKNTRNIFLRNGKRDKDIVLTEEEVASWVIPALIEAAESEIDRHIYELQQFLSEKEVTKDE